MSHVVSIQTQVKDAATVRAACQRLNLPTGEMKMDDFGGRWGDRRHLDKFLQMYAVEKARIEARKRGHALTEATLPDGSIKLTINVGGAA